MNYLRSLLGIAAILIAVSSPATAGLIQTNDEAFGAGQDGFNLTQDTGTGLEWLDVTLSVGLSFDFITTQFDAGGQFEGFRYATTSDVIAFFDNAGVRDGSMDPGIVDLDLSLNAVVADFLDLTGRFTLGDSIAINSGMFDDGSLIDNAVGRAYAQEFFGIQQGRAPRSDISPNSNNLSFHDLTTGSFLVREISPAEMRAIPEPGTLAIFGLGLLGMALISRRKSLT